VSTIDKLEGDFERIGGALRAAIAGSEAAKLAGSATALFEAGGKHILAAGTQKLVRETAEKSASAAIATVTSPLLGPGAAKPILALASRETVKTIAKQSARAAGSQVLRGAGKAAGIGFVIDGAVAGVEAGLAYRNGSIDRNTAMKHVATEAATGAVATATGVLLGAGLVALTGGVAAPVVFAVGAIGAMSTKKLLRHWVLRGQITAR
jgi:hypothetical protein